MEPPSYDEVVRGQARPACLHDDEADGMPLLFRDGPLEIAVESMEAAPAWRQGMHPGKQAKARKMCVTWGVTATLMLTFLILSFSTASLYRSAPEALNTVEASCPEELPTELLPQFEASATLYNTSLTFTRHPGAAGTAPQPFDVVAQTTQRLVPQQSTHCLAVRVPAAVAATLRHIYLTALPTTTAAADAADGDAARAPSQLCVCAAADDDSPAPLPSTSDALKCPTTCDKALQLLTLNSTDDVYRHGQWHRLSLPEKVEAGRELELTWLSAPAAAFAASAPYELPACADGGSAPAPAQAQGNAPPSPEPVGPWLTNVSAPVCSPGGSRIERALLTAPPQFMPDVLADGAARAAHILSVAAPSDLQVLWSTPAEHWTHHAGVTTTTFRSVRFFNGNMLTLAIGRFRRLATTLDSRSRRFSVWALPGAQPSAAQLPLRVLAGVVPPWERVTGQALQQLGKLDMLVWDGESPWSSASFGLLWMDRFRTPWDPAISTASDLVRTAHIVCHESGHHWFGGLVQTLTRDRGFIEESTTSYGEVACVAAALPALNNSAIYREMFAPPFQDTRGIHIGALFHALDEFTRPSLARTGIAGSIDGRYAKGAAFLHMVEDYLEAATGPGSMHDVLTGFTAAFRHKAATADSLLCHFAARLSSVPVDVLQRSVPGCHDALPVAVDDDSAVNGTRADAASLQAAGEWLERLQAWQSFPGVPLLRLDKVPGQQGDDKAFETLQLRRQQSPWLPRTEVEAHNAVLSLFVLFHFLHEPRLQGTEQPPQPVWTPVALTGTTPMAAEANATAQANDTTASDLQAQPEYATRWTEVNPVSSVAKCSEDNTAEPAGCKWTRVSQPLQLRLSHAPYIAKAHASGVYVVLHDDTAGKARTDAEIKLLQNLKLQTLTDARDLPASSNENHLLRGCMHLINDRRLQLRLVPASAATAQLRKVLRAAARAPAATQSGMAAYALLSPVAHALEDVQLLARGNKAHMARALKDKADTLVHAGEHLWKRSLRVGAKQQDASQWSQDTLFAMIATARTAPAAAVKRHSLATAACGLLPAGAKDLRSLKAALRLPPDLENVVMEIAVARLAGCAKPKTDVTALLLRTARRWVKEAQAFDAALQAGAPKSLPPAPPLHQHDRRSVAFVLAASADAKVAQWLATEVAFKGGAGGMGLRVPDRAALLERMARQSMAGFNAVRSGAEASAKRLNATATVNGAGAASWAGTWDREEAAVLRQSLALAVPPTDKGVPGWARESGIFDDEHVREAEAWLSAEAEAADKLFAK